MNCDINEKRERQKQGSVEIGGAAEALVMRMRPMRRAIAGQSTPQHWAIGARREYWARLSSSAMNCCCVRWKPVSGVKPL